MVRLIYFSGKAPSPGVVLPHYANARRVRCVCFLWAVHGTLEVFTTKTVDRACRSREKRHQIRTHGAQVSRQKRAFAYTPGMLGADESVVSLRRLGTASSLLCPTSFYISGLRNIFKEGESWRDFSCPP